MGLTVLIGTALLLGTCVYSQPPPCKTTSDVCQSDSDCTPVNGEVTKCNMKAGKCCEPPANAPSCKTTSDLCQSDSDCTSVNGEVTKCNMKAGKCCEPQSDALPTQCMTTTSDLCQTDSDCQKNTVWGDKGMCNTEVGQCCDLSAHGGDTDMTDLDNPCPAIKDDGPWNCTGLTACQTANQGTCGTDKYCCQAGICGNRCLPDLSICVETEKILLSVVADTNCLSQIEGVLSAQTFRAYCGSLVGGLQCVSKKLTQGFDSPVYSGLCFQRMMRFMYKDPTVIFDEIKKYMTMLNQPFDIREDFVSESGKCSVSGGDDKDEDDDEEKDWNSSCPKMDDEGGLCPATECSADSDCGTDKPKCCSLGSEECRACMPDLKQCGDLTRIMANPKAMACLPKLAQLGVIKNYTRYCSVIWDAFDCMAENVMPDDASMAMCKRRMAVYVQKSPSLIIRIIRTALEVMSQDVTGITMLSRYAKGTSECKESPLHKAPERPVPDDVKVCFNKESIMGAAAQCGRITGSRATNEACGSLKNIITCIAAKLVPAQDVNLLRKCAGEISDFVEKNGGQLSNVFGNLRPEACVERSTVCGGDMHPLDISCSTQARCPANYVCNNGYCCPQEKQGWCPAQESGERSLCKRKCTMDSQCDDDEKCCMSKSCGYTTCLKMEMEKENKSRCDREFEEGKRQLQNQGICGDGTTLTKLPNCQNRRFSPMQTVTENLRGYCVMENGTKISGSDFIGNRDCTKVRQGRCPTPPAACKSIEKNADTCQSDDFRCSGDQKCCIVLEGDTCFTKCVKAEKAPETVPDDCADRKCCPVTLCDDKVCLKDKTAVCRINSCGKCEAEFFNLKGEKVNCNEGVSLCQRQRAQAREDNARRQKSDFERLSSFLMSRDRGEKERREEPDADDDDDDEEMEKDMKDEYGMSRQERDDIPDDTEGSDEMEDMHDRMASVSLRLCAIFDKFNFCQNGGECKIGKGESFWEICKCKSGYSGLFCETTGPVKPLDSQCFRDHQRIQTISSIMMGTDNIKERNLLRDFFNKMKPPQKIMSPFDCDPTTGDYKEIQMGKILPNTINSIMIYYCVDTKTGLRKEGTPVTLAKSERMPNCGVTAALPDIMGLPKGCMSMNMSICTAADKCEYFLNQETGMCEKGKAGGGFRTLTECYDQCTILRGCINSPTGNPEKSDDFVCEKGIISGPKPCRMADESNVEYDACDYNREFCDVLENGTGICTAFPSYCLEGPDSGFGSRQLGAYFYNAMTRKCEKFTYKGSAGNRNRFYSLHQCHTECGPRHYKFDDLVCPVPKLLAMAMENAVHMCDEDMDCHDNEVCCSTGKAKICTSHTRTCFTSLRCSVLGSCLEGKCVCDDCSNAVKSEVCGSDGMTYASACHLKQKACRMMQNITVASSGSCKTKCGDGYCESYEMCENNVCMCPDVCIAQYEPVCGKSTKSGAYCSFSNSCKMTVKSCQMKERIVQMKAGLCMPEDSPNTCHLQCTKEYNPVCVYDMTENIPKLETYGNPCLIKEALLNGKKLKVLSPGECTQKCGDTECVQPKVCYNNTCACHDGCTREYRPICAHPQGNDDKLITFSNLCLMKQQSCKEGKLYMIVKHGACKDPEHVYECPETKPDIPFSATVECKPENNAGCDTDMGEKCCHYGAGMKCLPKKALVLRKTVKDGLCPNFNGNNFDSTMCKSSECMSDDDCGGDSKCCENAVCGHMTCAAPIVKGDKSPCGPNGKMISHCAPNADETGCPARGTCNSFVTAENENVGVCCVPKEQSMTEETKKELMQSQLCMLMVQIGITCENGGTCIGDLRGGKVCQCMAGYFGPFCRDTLPLENCGVEVNCPANPCDVTKCPGVPEATCKANYCGSCNALFKNGTDDVTHLCQATPCLVQRAVMMGLVQAVSEDKTEMEDKDDMESRRKRRDMHMEDNEDDMDEEPNPFKKDLMYLTKHMGIRHAPECTAEGSFKLEQCAPDMMSDSQYCYCVNGHTGTPIPNGPRERSLSMLNCTDLSSSNMGLQDFCWKEMPSKKICSGTMTYRFFYNPMIMDCEIFSDYGCNVDAQNNFYNYATCKSACGVRNTVLSKCATVRCGFGQRCFIKDGNATCIDPDTINAKFEPTCEADGKFSPKQCNGEMCKCVNRDTGAALGNSEAEGAHLKCEREGDTVKPMRTQTKRCAVNTPAKFCDNGGDVCNNCEVDDNQGNARNDDSKVDENNVCKSCQSCPTGQGRQMCNTEKLCENKCKQFPGALCRINRCECKEEYYANNRRVNCSAVQSQCEKELHEVTVEDVEQTIKNNGREPQNRKQLKCKDGAYYAQCVGKQCFCLNATDGSSVGSGQTGKSLENIQCSEVQRKSLFKVLSLKLKFPSKNWSDLSTSKQEMFKRKLINKIESKSAVKVIRIEFTDGSIDAAIDIQKCEEGECIVESEVADLNSVGVEIVSQANEGELVVELDGETFAASSGTITDGVTAEELEGPVTEKAPEDDDNKTTIIIVVVVVIVVVILALGIAYYCYTKANKTRTKDIYFSDLQGNSNPAYGKA